MKPGGIVRFNKLSFLCRIPIFLTLFVYVSSYSLLLLFSQLFIEKLKLGALNTRNGSLGAKET